MQYTETELKGVFLISPRRFEDNRGWFMESFKQSEFEQEVAPIHFVQENQSYSKKGVLRGLHLQKAPYAQSKLVRCVQGKIWDVAVDIRKDSPQYGQYVGVELSEENQHQLFIPQGFLHGFVVLSEHAVVQYKVDAVYDKASEAGVRFDDPTLSIAWPLPIDACVLSEKDLELPFL